MEPTQLTQLVESVKSLQGVVQQLSDRADTQREILDRISRVATDTRHNRIGLQVATVGIVLNMIIAGFGVWLFVKVDSNTRQVQAVQVRTSSQILCPLYTVLSLSIKANPSPPNLTPDQIV